MTFLGIPKVQQRNGVVEDGNGGVQIYQRTWSICHPKAPRLSTTPHMHGTMGVQRPDAMQPFEE